MIWNDPSDEEIRAALEGWAWNGWQMTNVTVERVTADTLGMVIPSSGERGDTGFNDHGEHVFVTTDFKVNGKFAGAFRARYRADGVAFLEYVVLEDEFSRQGAMAQLLADFQQHYRDWGITSIQNPTPLEPGVAFAESQGYEQLGGPSLHVRDVAPE